MADANYMSTVTYQLLFVPERLPPNFFPVFDRIRGDEKYTSPADEESRRDIEDFTECQEVPLEVYRAGGTRGFDNPSLIMSFDQSLNLNNIEQDPMHEMISEQDNAVAMNTHFLRPAHKMFRFFELPGKFSQGRATWEATLTPVGLTYKNTAKDAEMQLTVRPDVVYGLKAPGTDLDFGHGEPNLNSRAFAIMEFKRKGRLNGLAQDLKGVGRIRPETRHAAPKFEKDSQLFLKQVVSYCFAYRTKFGAITDLNHLILLEFHGMKVDAGSTPEDVRNHGHGGKFKYTVLSKEQDAWKIVCYNGFLLKAAQETSRDH